MLQYQPGGLSERGAILQALESPAESTSISMAVTQLGKWIRWKRRAVDMGVAIPDSSILMRGLSRIMKKLIVQHPELNFRLSLVRNALQVDTIPSCLESVTQYSQQVLAELEQMRQHSKKKELPAEVVPKMRKVEENPKEEDRGHQKGKLPEEGEEKKRRCKFFTTDSGCKTGGNCQFAHIPDGERRCYLCGAKDHMSLTPI